MNWYIPSQLRNEYLAILRFFSVLISYGLFQDGNTLELDETVGDSSTHEDIPETESEVISSRRNTFRFDLDQ